MEKIYQNYNIVLYKLYNKDKEILQKNTKFHLMVRNDCIHLFCEDKLNKIVNELGKKDVNKDWTPDRLTAYKPEYYNKLVFYVSNNKKIADLLISSDLESRKIGLKLLICKQNKYVESVFC